MALRQIREKLKTSRQRPWRNSRGLVLISSAQPRHRHYNGAWGTDFPNLWSNSAVRGWIISQRVRSGLAEAKRNGNGWAGRQSKAHTYRGREKSELHERRALRSGNWQHNSALRCSQFTRLPNDEGIFENYRFQTLCPSKSNTPVFE